MSFLHNGDPFPSLAIPALGGMTLSLPDLLRVLSESLSLTVRPGVLSARRSLPAMRPRRQPLMPSVFGSQRSR
jgi:hypothetical protein